MAHRVFPEEIECDRAVSVEADVLGAEGGGADGLSFLCIVFLVADSELAVVDEECDRGGLLPGGVLGVQVVVDVALDFLDLFPEARRILFFC